MKSSLATSRVVVGSIVLALIAVGTLVITSLFVDMPKRPPKQIATQDLQVSSQDVQKATKVFHINDCLSLKHDPDWIRLPKPGTDSDPIAIGGPRSLSWVKFSCNESKYVDEFTKRLRQQPGRAQLVATPVRINAQEGRIVEFVDGKDKRAFYYVQSKRRVCVAETWGSPENFDKNVMSVRAALTTLACE